MKRFFVLILISVCYAIPEGLAQFNQALVKDDVSIKFESWKVEGDKVKITVKVVNHGTNDLYGIPIGGIHYVNGKRNARIDIAKSAKNFKKRSGGFYAGNQIIPVYSKFNYSDQSSYNNYGFPITNSNYRQKHHIPESTNEIFRLKYLKALSTQSELIFDFYAPFVKCNNLQEKVNNTYYLFVAGNMYNFDFKETRKEYFTYESGSIVGSMLYHTVEHYYYKEAGDQFSFNSTPQMTIVSDCFRKFDYLDEDFNIWAPNADAGKSSHPAKRSEHEILEVTAFPNPVYSGGHVTLGFNQPIKENEIADIILTDAFTRKDVPVNYQFKDDKALIINTKEFPAGFYQVTILFKGKSALSRRIYIQ